jgi:hypothetical protein
VKAVNAVPKLADWLQVQIALRAVEGVEGVGIDARVAALAEMAFASDAVAHNEFSIPTPAHMTAGNSDEEIALAWEVKFRFTAVM